jgi:hypothetical protein
VTRAPDVIGEVLGFRAWIVEVPTLSPPRLGSLFTDLVWEPRGWTVATCESGLEGVPHKKHYCGIYAARDRRHLVRLGYNDSEDEVVAIGEVALAGDIIPGERGWRGEKARPVRLWVAHVDWRLVRSLAAEYRIPVGLTNLLARGGARGYRS